MEDDEADRSALDAESALDLAQRLVAGFDALREALPPPPGGLSERLKAHLGAGWEELPGVVERFASSERVNIQIALDDLEGRSPQWELIGLQSDVGNFGGFSITALVRNRFGGHIGAQPVEYVNLPTDVDRTLRCFSAGIVLTTYEEAALCAVLFTVDRGMEQHVVLEIVASREDAAEAFIVELRSIMRAKNVFRGKVLSFSFGRHGEFGLAFARVPELERHDVILPEDALLAVEAHTIRMSELADGLRQAGQHLRRGLLLYGPPGTGKTHTVMYLCNQLEGRTVFLLAGAAVQALGQAGALARELSPSMIVIEDVDLIGMDRGLPGGEHNAMLFQLLNQMDGIGNDVDVIFVLTTNRVDLLEPALAARPGRVDRAIEVGLPDEDARRRLLDLYLPDGAEIEQPVIDVVVARTERVAAAFIKELARRAVLLSLSDEQTLTEALPRALDEMLVHSAPVLRRTLGLATDQPG